MEKIIINTFLYKVPNGTNDKIRELLKKSENATDKEHENNTAYNAYNSFLESIMDNRKGEYIDNVFQTMY